MRKTWFVTAALLIGGGLLVAAMTIGAGDAQSNRRPSSQEWEPRPSAMGAIARGDVPRPSLEQIAKRSPVVPFRSPASLVANAGSDVIVHDPAAIDFQAEDAIAVSGNLVVVGYNDMRGFLNSPVSVCGFSYSNDGGMTWTDGGQLPTAGASDEVLGDPDVKTWTDSGSSTTYFFYSSLYRTAHGDNSLCVHVSTDGGQRWSAPREVNVATSATDFPDKPLMDVDPDTGRIYLAWTKFGADWTVTINFSYSDDQGQSWSTPAVFNSIGQGAIPRAGDGNTAAYIAWLSGGTIQLVKSVDNGTTWGAPFTLVANVVVPVLPIGSDRMNSFPALALDGPNVYVAYAGAAPAAKTGDTSDIYFTYSDDAGVSFSTPTVISRNTFLSDRAQFFPYLAVDQSSGNIAVMYYDQARSITTTDVPFIQDLTEVSVAISTNGGTTFSCPITLSDKPFHAETGNTMTAANLGEYSQCVFEGGTLYAAFTKTDLPLPTTNAPDTYADVTTPGSIVMPPVRIRSIDILDTGCTTDDGILDPGETAEVRIVLENTSFCTNRIQNGSGTITTTNPHVTILTDTATWPRIGVVGNTQLSTPYLLYINEGAFDDPFVEFKLSFTSAQGDIELFFELAVGQPVETPLISEQFEGAGFPDLPSGWENEVLGGTSNPWVRDITYTTSGVLSAFCRDIAVTSHNRMKSPVVSAGNVDEWILRYKTTYNMENDGPRRAWDGFSATLIVDGEPYPAASIGTISAFYSHVIHEGDPAVIPMAGRSVWSGNMTPSFRPVEMRFRGLAGSNIQVAFDAATDNVGGTSGGAWIDDVELIAVDYQPSSPTCLDLIARPRELDLGNVLTQQTYCDSFFLVNLSPFMAATIDSIRNNCPAIVSVDTSQTTRTVASGDSTVVIVCITPTQVGAGSCNITVSNTSTSGDLVVPVTWDATLTVTGINNGMPAPFEIESVAPNPFNPSTTVRFRLPEAMPVTAEVWSVNGARVKTLARDRVFAAGSNTIRWDGTNDAGNAVASGVYFIRVQNRVGHKVARAILLK